MKRIASNSTPWPRPATFGTIRGFYSFGVAFGIAAGLLMGWLLWG